MQTLEIADARMPALLLARAHELAERPALLDGVTGRTLTYGALAEGVERIAAGLAARGFGRGDVLAINAPNAPEWPLPVLGALAAGGTVTTANPLYTAGELATQLADARARILVTAAPFADTAREAAARAGVEEVVLLGERSLDGDGPAPPPAADPDDVALLLYSSGTTGVPKGVMLTHRQVAANVAQMAARIPAGDGEAVLAVAPFFHALGLNALLARSLAAGATIVTLARFEIEPFLAAIQEHRVTQTVVVPADPDRARQAPGCRPLRPLLAALDRLRRCARRARARAGGGRPARLRGRPGLRHDRGDGVHRAARHDAAGDGSCAARSGACSRARRAASSTASCGSAARR